MFAAPTRRRAAAKLRAALARILSDAGGAVAIEFGFVAPALLFTMIAIFQIGYTYFGLAGLDAASRAGARAIMTGSVQQAGMTSAQFISNVICPNLPSTMRCSSVVVNVSVVLSNPTPLGLTSSTTAASLPAAAEPTNYYNYVASNDSGLIFPSTTQASDTFCPGFAGDIVMVQVLYPAPLFTRILNSANASSLWEMSTSTFMNEPFGGAQAYTGC
ncbi:MAG TPA: TadE family protein [Methylocystis sp.]|nr:TadE family protein [Methylocystis sp.]